METSQKKLIFLRYKTYFSIQFQHHEIEFQIEITSTHFQKIQLRSGRSNNLNLKIQFSKLLIQNFLTRVIP